MADEDCSKEWIGVLLHVALSAALARVCIICIVSVGESDFMAIQSVLCIALRFTR